MDCLRISEPHLGLGGMNVHVDPCGIDLEEKHEGRMALVMQHVVEGLPDGVCEQLVAYEAAIDKRVLVVATAAVKGRRGDKAVQPYIAVGLIQG